ncbi:MAG TPA: hypothetical protein PLO70_09210 [Chitinophagaceae bacterium]|nr:hypothetical protein [Chitinophagaceae bacterium]HQZ74685.1 hypothetical protein [Chitinophagaceae bacterium]
MKTAVLTNLFFVLVLTACSSAKNNIQTTTDDASPVTTIDQPFLAPEQKPLSLMDLPQTQDGGFVLQPGFYEAEFKTYCLQPGTPDPREGDAYLQGPVTGYRKSIVESILLNSRDQQDMEQKNIQLLLWSTVSGADYSKLSPAVKADATRLLTPKQIFELKGGVMGLIKDVSRSTGVLNGNSDIKKLFETSIDSYEAYENIAVRREQSKVIKRGVKYDQWYKQQENYYVRYYPVSYKKVRIQVYMPENILDADNKLNNEYVVFDPTGQQAIPAFTNAQRLGIGAPVIAVIREIIKVNKQTTPPKKVPEKKKNPKTGV